MMPGEPLSPELRGGGGIRFEDAVAASYLVSLLAETPAPGSGGRRIVRVALQQAAAGEPMDDVIVDSVGLDGKLARMSLQVKRQLVISSARSNSDFRDVVRAGVATMRRGGFRSGSDRFGVVAGTISASARRDAIFVCDLAGGAESFESFHASLFTPGFASTERKAVFAGVSSILLESGEADPDRTAYEMLRHLVVIEMDLLHPGATDDATSITTLASVLRPEAADTARELWDRLRIIARDGATIAAVYSRPALVGQLGGAFRLAGARSFQRTLRLLSEEARAALADIPNEIGGRTYRRERPAGEAAASRAVMTHIVGLPGCGKSAVLRVLAEASLTRGPVLFLKSGRLEGANWRTYATAMGLGDEPLADLLAELAAAGDGVVYIDGIDRVEVASRGVVLDVLNTILSDLGKSGLRIVATMRGSEFEPLANWMPENLLTGTGTKVVQVPSFDDAESDLIARDLPALRPLLFGGERLQEIARRPFFTAILARPVRARSRPSPDRLSEVDLASLWWDGGGMAAEGSRLAKRQRTLLALARSGSASLGQRMPVAELDADAVRELRADGVIRDVRRGHTVGFAHDILFEWAFLQLLVGQEREWTAVVQSAGEPPALGRAVELLSQWTFEQDDGWADQYRCLAGMAIRSQWRRAWLCGPFDSPRFEERQERLTELLEQEGGMLPERLVLWFQAERTRPNPLVLEGKGTTGDKPARDRARLADILAWPADIHSWSRFITYVLDNHPDRPDPRTPAVVEALAVWLNVFRSTGIDMPLSRRIHAVMGDWLRVVEEWRHGEDRYSSRDDGVGLPGEIAKSLEGRLRGLLLVAGPHETSRVAAYLTRLASDRELARASFDHVAAAADRLVQAGHAAVIRRIVLAACLEDLPETSVAEETSGRGTRRIGWGFSSHDWRTLSMDRIDGLSPPSPARQPFAALFRYAPDEGRALVGDLANHAITAWRQLHRLSYERRGTPIPETIEWPWGETQYWGGEQTYCWPRGHWAPDAVSAGLMALEAWAIREVGGGRSVDEVICDVVEGHEGNAVLSTAVLLGLMVLTESAALVSLVSSQRVWRWEERRFREDLGGAPNLGGFVRPDDGEYADAVRSLNGIPARRLMMGSLAMSIVVREGGASASARRAIEGFTQCLPFDAEEERADPSVVEHLVERASFRAAFGRLDNYNIEATPERDGMRITFDDPKRDDPQRQAEVRMSEVWLAHTQTAMWASKALESPVRISREDYQSHIDRVRDGSADGGTTNAEEREFRERVSGASAAVAAACLALADDLTPEEIAWCRETTLKAARTPPGPGDLHHPMVASFLNPVELASHGLAGVARRRTASDDELSLLLRNCMHPLDALAVRSVIVAVGLHGQEPGLAWTALTLCLTRAIVTPGHPDPDRPGGRPYTGRQRLEGALAGVERWISDRAYRAALPDLPAPVARDPDAGPRRGRPREPGDTFLDHDFLGRAIDALPWASLVTDPEIGEACTDILGRLVAWTAAGLQPQGSARHRDDRSVTELTMWGYHLYGAIAKASLALPRDVSMDRLLEPAFSLPDEACLMLLHRFVSGVSASGVMDPPVISPTAIVLLRACAERVSRVGDLAVPSFHRRGFRSHELGPLIRDLLFVAMDGVSGAARFANGAFGDLGAVLPVVSALAGQATRSSPGLHAYLSLCERSINLFPTRDFLDIILGILGPDHAAPSAWIGTVIPGRIAAVVHDLADRDTPLTPGTARDILAILDALVDIGDRRSAALQSSQTFREVRAG